MFNPPHGALNWYACYTKPRHERRAERLLRERGVESYLPTIQRVSQWKDRKRLIRWPLFAGYVFGRFESTDFGRVLATGGVLMIVRMNGRFASIPDGEFEAMRRLVDVAGGLGIEPALESLAEDGQWVRVLDGAFKDIEGQIIRRRNKQRVIVGLRAIGRGLEVDIPIVLLQRIPPPVWATQPP
jgi:transcription antitermination factor NusG